MNKIKFACSLLCVTFLVGCASNKNVYELQSPIINSYSSSKSFYVDKLEWPRIGKCKEIYNNENYITQKYLSGITFTTEPESVQTETDIYKVGTNSKIKICNEDNLYKFEISEESRKLIGLSTIPIEKQK